MSREILIHIQKGRTQVAIIQDGKLDEFHIEMEHIQSIVGNIYKGRVESILPSINGAFVNIGEAKNGFLYLTDADNPFLFEEAQGPQRLLRRILKRRQQGPAPREQKAPALRQGQELLVQVVKDPFGNKGPRLTTHISLAGRFVVYMPYDPHGGVSKKIEAQGERQRLREVLKEISAAHTGGFIVRTVSFEQDKKELLRDARFLMKIWYQITRRAEKTAAPALIHKEYDLIWKVVRDYLTAQVDKVIIDSQPDYIRLRKFVMTLIGREHVDKVHFYKGHTPLFEAKAVSRELEKIYDPKVLLPSGAYIVIEPTEGLIVVDVNSGRFRTHASPEDAAFMVNMEAAGEIARQLRLRDLGGIIVIDFIDMSREVHKRKVLEALQAALEKDRAKTEVNRISPLGLVEMTRARTSKTVESMTFEPCPYCEGRGKMRIG